MIRHFEDSRIQGFISDPYVPLHFCYYRSYTSVLSSPFDSPSATRQPFYTRHFQDGLSLALRQIRTIIGQLIAIDTIVYVSEQDGDTMIYSMPVSNKV